eukprot:TRINITY_DN13_c0_g1_i1.p1 TRINITY_DN13_c0_g1~~TRINITY_DN13_c0_g1_i1.p1  ORF type:complete len:380 (+),score=104.78 TRINITY_DN13_c0_g1_i1:75-1214(+)
MAEVDEKKVLAEFRKKLKDEGVVLDPTYFDEWTTIRFLKARKFVIEDAYEMLTNHLKWREENGVNDILETAPKEINFKNLEKYWPGMYAGVDKQGIPIWIDRLTQIDPESFLTSVPMSSIINYHIYTTEKAMRKKMEISASKKENCYAGVVIEDMDGFGKKHMTSACIDLFKQINAINEANYPECLKAFFCINSPMMVSVAYKLVKSFIDPETRKKVFVLGAKYTDEVLEYVNADQLLEEYGGKYTAQKLKGGGIYSDFRKDGTTYNPHTINIGAGKKTTMPITAEAGSVINWTLYESNNDFKFSITCDGKEIEKPEMRTVTEEVSGKVDVEKAGTYEFHFDNGHSWVKGRTVKFHIVLKSPKKEGKKKKKSKKKKSKK